MPEQAPKPQFILGSDGELLPVDDLTSKLRYLYQKSDEDKAYVKELIEQAKKWENQFLPDKIRNYNRLKLLISLGTAATVYSLVAIKTLAHIDVFELIPDENFQLIAPFLFAAVLSLVILAQVELFLTTRKLSKEYEEQKVNDFETFFEEILDLGKIEDRSMDEVVKEISAFGDELKAEEQRVKDHEERVDALKQEALEKHQPQSKNQT
jgi:hypothetical protein